MKHVLFKREFFFTMLRKIISSALCLFFLKGVISSPVVNTYLDSDNITVSLSEQSGYDENYVDSESLLHDEYPDYEYMSLEDAYQEILDEIHAIKTRSFPTIPKVEKPQVKKPRESTIKDDNIVNGK